VLFDGSGEEKTLLVRYMIRIPSSNTAPVSYEKGENGEWDAVLSRFEVGAEIDACDEFFTWYTAVVRAVDGSRALVHFDGWQDKYDEWLDLKSGSRVAPLNANTAGGLKTSGSKGGVRVTLREGTLVQIQPVRGPGKDWVMASIVEADAKDPNTVRVMFDNGFGLFGQIVEEHRELSKYQVKVCSEEEKQRYEDNALAEYEDDSDSDDSDDEQAMLRDLAQLMEGGKRGGEQNARCASNERWVRNCVRGVCESDWTPDTGHCEHCDEGFGFFKHRHHCRGCGDNVCHDCSPYEADVSTPGGMRMPDVRVCRRCYLLKCEGYPELPETKSNQALGGSCGGGTRQEDELEEAGKQWAENDAIADMEAMTGGEDDSDDDNDDPLPPPPAPKAAPPMEAPPAAPKKSTMKRTPSGGRILTKKEFHKAVFVSHSRRDAGPLNATYAVLQALRSKTMPDGSAFSTACHEASRVVELWTDKEQMAESGGDNWSEILALAQARSLINVFFLGNAYCGSRECRKEIQFADMKRFRMVPVFLEGFANDQDDFDAAVVRCPWMCDADRREFEDFESGKMTMERLTWTLQGVPAFLDMSAFLCEKCRTTRDAVCPDCADFDKAVARSRDGGAKLIETAAVLGKYIDAAALEKGFLQC